VVRSVSIVGSTGSIGTQTIDVVSRRPDLYRVEAIGAYSSVEKLAAQAEAVRPEIVALGDSSRAKELERRLPAGTTLVSGEAAFAEISRIGDVVVNGVVGFAGLTVTLATLFSGRRLALANKESLIAAAPLVQRARATEGAEIVPVDSEHCAIHQCLGQQNHRREVVGVDEFMEAPRQLRRMILTASGGPFRMMSPEELAYVSVDAALAHPTWKMGPKITIDSSTLMNKGLEVIEAHELFGVDYDQIEVVVHPQSIVHSMVEWSDGATICQLSYPDMRLPIGYALSYPERFPVEFGAIDWTALGQLDFSVPDRSTFRCLDLAYAAGREGGSAPAWLSAANEVAVAAFLEGRIGWSTIADIVEETLSRHESTALVEIEDVLEADARAREVARDVATVAAR